MAVEFTKQFRQYTPLSGKTLICGCAVGALALTASSARGVTVGDADLFGPSQTVNVSDTYPSAAFTGSNLVDGTNHSFVFNDSNQLASVSGFNSAISSLRFFNTPSYDGRTSGSVTIYYSSTNQTSIDLANYTLLGAFDLPRTGSNNNDYTTATNPADHPDAGDPAVNTSATISYDQLDGLAIPAGTQSVLFSFAGGGDGLTEIQAFTPEPASIALISCAVPFLARRRR